MNRRKFIRGAFLWVPSVSILVPKFAKAQFNPGSPFFTAGLLKPAAGGGGGGIALVQARTSGNNDAVNSATLAFLSDVTSGNRIVICGCAWHTSAAPTSITITKSSGTATIGSVTMDLGDIPSMMTWRTWIAYLEVTGSGSLTLDVNPSDASNSFSFTIAEFSGVTQLDVDGGQTDAITANPSDSITTVAASTLVVGVMSHDGTTEAITAASGWTLTGANTANSSNQCHGMAHRIESSAGTFSGQFTFANSGGARQTCQTLSLKP